VISCAYLMMGLPWITWVRFGAWLVVGIAVYMSYGYRKSGLLRG
jgi:APA family basic amino acid/polyamine antiporter